MLYDTGVIVYYLVPRPLDEELETDDPWAEPLEEASDSLTPSESQPELRLSGPGGRRAS